MKDCSPYFYNLSRHILSETVRKDLAALALENVDQIKPGAPKDWRRITQPSGNDFLKITQAPEPVKQIVENIRSQIIHPFYTLTLAKQEPGKEVLRHTDLRQAIIINPLYPIEDFEPTMFWADYDSQEPLATCHYPNGLPSLLNPRHIHNIHNRKPTYRLAFQIEFHELDYAQALEKLLAGNLIEFAD